MPDPRRAILREASVQLAGAADLFPDDPLSPEIRQVARTVMALRNKIPAVSSSGGIQFLDSEIRTDNPT